MRRRHLQHRCFQPVFICLATTDNDEMRRIHRVCETLSAAAPDDRRRRGSNQTISKKLRSLSIGRALRSNISSSQAPAACARSCSRAEIRARTQDVRAGARHDHGAERALVHLQATAPGFPAYWLDVEAGMDATLEALDSLLRHDWVECCGHLSMFTIGSMNYYSRGYSLETGRFQLLAGTDQQSGG